MRLTAIVAQVAILIGFLVPAGFVLANAAGWWTVPDFAPFESMFGLPPEGGTWAIIGSAAIGAIVCWSGMWLERRAQKLKSAQSRRDFARFGVGLIVLGLFIPAVVFLAAVAVSS